MAGRSQAEVARRKELFVAAYAQTGDATASAIAAGYSGVNARKQGDRWMTLPDLGPRARKARDVAVAVQLSQFERQQEALKEAADSAITALAEIATRAPVGPDGKPDKSYHAAAVARVAAAVAILDRAGHKPVERVESKNEHTFTPADTNEVDSRIARAIAARSGESGAGITQH